MCLFQLTMFPCKWVTQRGMWNFQGCPGEEEGQRGLESHMGPFSHYDGQRCRQKGCGSCHSHSRGHNPLPQGCAHHPRAGEGTKVTFPTGTDAIWSYDKFSCNAGSCCLVLPCCRGNTAPGRGISHQEPLLQCKGNSAVRRSHLLGFSRPLFFLSFSWLSCVIVEISQKTQENRLWEMCSLRLLPPGTCPSHHHHIQTAPMVSLLAPGSKRSCQKSAITFA